MSEQIIVNWDFFNNDIPIEDVCDVLDIKIYDGNKIKCPSHNDHRPSAAIKDNHYFCFVCNTGGSPLNLVLAKKFGVTRDQLIQARKNETNEYGKAIMGSVRFLDSYFPGGLKRIVKEEKKNDLPVPAIPREILHELGLKGNPIEVNCGVFVEQKYISGKNSGNICKKTYIDTDDMFLTKTEKAGFLYDLLLNKEQEYLRYADEICRNFPELDENAISVIYKKVDKWIDNIRPYINLVKNYYFAQQEIDFPEENIFEKIDQELDDVDMDLS